MSALDNPEEIDNANKQSPSDFIKDAADSIVGDKMANKTSKRMIFILLAILVITSCLAIYINNSTSSNLLKSGKITEGIIIENTQINYWVNDMNPQRITQDFVSYYYFINRDSVSSSFNIRFDKFDEYSEAPFKKGDTVLIRYNPKIINQSELLKLKEVQGYKRD